MPTGTFQGTFKVSGTGITVSAGGAAVLLVGAYALTHQKQAAADLGGAAVTAAVVVGVVAVAAVVAVFLRLRARSRRRAAAPSPAPVFWKHNPRSIPAPPRREIAAPVVNVNIDASLLAGLMNAMQQQPVRVTAEPVEQQEIPR